MQYIVRCEPKRECRAALHVLVAVVEAKSAAEAVRIPTFVPDGSYLKARAEPLEIGKTYYY